MPGHVPARAHGTQRGRGPRPCAAREGAAVSCQAGGTRSGESPAGRRPGSAAVLPREPRRSAAPRASAACRTPRRARPAGGELGDELCEVADRGRPTDEAYGLGPGGRGRGNVRLDRRPPWVRPGAPPRLRVAPRRDARAGGRARRARHGGARRARGPRASWRASGGSLFGPRFPPQSHVPEWRRQVAQTYQAGEEVVS